MALLTIFTAPKPFINPHIDIIQRNAIQSWLHLGSEVEVFLVGDEAGMGEVAAEFEVRQLPEVSCNDSGTPLVNSIFAAARRASGSPLLAYINADIILLPDFLDAAKKVSQQLDRFLIIGQRWDLDIHESLDFSDGWDQRFKSILVARGNMHLPAGSDYFLFPRSLTIEMPDFAIGRAGWDNWMIYHARKQGWSVVDGTPSIIVIHQNHDYSHLPDSKPHYELDESRTNETLAGGSANLYMVLDSDKQLVDGRVRPPKMTFLRILRRAEVWFTPSDGTRRGTRWYLARHFRRIRRKMTGSL